MLFNKSKDSKVIEIEDSSFVCSKCIKKMGKFEKNNVVVFICPKCNGMILDKFNIDNTLQFFLKEGRIV